MVEGPPMELDQLARDHICGVCRGLLVVAYSRTKSKHELRCGNNYRHRGFARELSYTQAYKQGIPVPLYIQNQIERRLGMSQEPQINRYEVVNQRTGETKVVEALSWKAAIEKLKWPEEDCYGTTLSKEEGTRTPAIVDVGTQAVLVPEKMRELMVWCETVKLRPELGHVCAYFGKVYPTVDGLMYHARRQDREMRYLLHYLNPDQKAEIGIGPEDAAVQAEVYSSSGAMLSTRLGIVTKEEQELEIPGKEGHHRYPVLHKKPLEMAENRALWDALMDAFPLGLEDEARNEG